MINNNNTNSELFHGFLVFLKLPASAIQKGTCLTETASISPRNTCSTWAGIISCSMMRLSSWPSYSGSRRLLLMSRNAESWCYCSIFYSFRQYAKSSVLCS